MDIDPPAGFNTESKLLLLPFSFMTRCYVLTDLYAGKNRVKGGDWYDFEWYVRNNLSLNFNHFFQRAYQSGLYKNGALTRDLFKQLLKDKIAHTNIETVKADVRPFIKNVADLDIWSADYFAQLVDMIKFE